MVMLPNYRIRLFKPEDLEDVERINRIFLPENYPSYFFMENYRRFPNSFLVAETDEGKIVGYVMCRVEPHYIKGITLILGHVLSIAVSKEHRRRGIGEALMLKAEEGLLTYGSEVIYLEVRVSNEPAIRLYEKLGYKKLGIIPFYYADGEDAFLMYKVVKEGLDDSLVYQALGRRVTS
ncbi:MAG: ribosomal protein S18-alanine N-acetyltransferase [Candidatus Korarchaeum sp.]